MKKWLACIIVMFCALAVFAGGGKDKTAGTWYSDYELAKKTAQKYDKKIFFAVTGDSPDNRSNVLLNTIFTDETFCQTLADEYVLLNLDFSTAGMATVELSEDATEEQRKQDLEQSQSVQNAFQHNYETVSLYSIETVPTVLILSREGYVLAAIADDRTVTDAQGYLNLIASAQAQIDEKESLVEAVHSAKGVAKVQAIDALYTSTPAVYQYVLADLVKAVPSLDKKNESGLLGKYSLQSAYYSAMELFAGGDITDAVQCFVDVADGDLLTASEKQEAYYLAAYLTAQSNPDSPDLMLEYLRKSYESDPENENAESIQQIIVQLEASKAAMEAASETEEDTAENSVQEDVSTDE